MESWGNPVIKEEPADDERQQATTQAMGLDRIMSGLPSSSAGVTAPWTGAVNDADSSPTPNFTSSNRFPAHDIILSTLHQLLDPTLQPPPPQMAQALPRRPASVVPAFDNAARNRPAPAHNHNNTNGWPPSHHASSARPLSHHSTSTTVSSSDRSQRDQESSGLPLSVPGAHPASSANSTRAPALLHLAPPGVPLGAPLDPSSLQQLLQMLALSGTSPQAALASLAAQSNVTAATIADPYHQQRQAMAALHETTTNTNRQGNTSTTKAQPLPMPVPHMPDPTYPRGAQPNKLPLPRAYSAASLVPSATSAFTSLKQSADRASPPRSPNSGPRSPSLSPARATTSRPAAPTIGPALAGLSQADPAVALAALTAHHQHQQLSAAPVPAALTGSEPPARMQQFAQLLFLLHHHHHHQQQQQHFAVAPLPYLSAPIVPIITTTPHMAPTSSSTSSQTAPAASSGKRARASGSVKHEGSTRHVRPRNDHPAGRTSSVVEAGMPPAGDPSRKRRLDDPYESSRSVALASASGMTKDGRSGQRVRRPEGGGSGDDEDAVKRRRINQNQLDVLEAAYLDDPLPSRRTKQRLSSQLGISIKRVQIWFQNRRAKHKRQRKDGSDSGGDTFPEEGSDDAPSGGLFGLMD